MFAHNRHVTKQQWGIKNKTKGGALDWHERILTYMVWGSITMQLTSCLTGLDWTKQVGESVDDINKTKQLNPYTDTSSPRKERVLSGDIYYLC